MTAPGFASGGTRVLFIGNSLTFTNNLPGMFEALARQAGINDVKVASVAYPDFALEDHWAEGTALKSLDNNKWEYVVMQQGSSALPASQINLRTWAAQFAPRIRASGAVPVMFMVWPTTSRLFDFTAVQTSYRDAAAAIDGIFAPAGDAWVAFGNASGSVYPMYSSDGLHPSVRGTYVSALVLLERIRGVKPEQLPAEIPGTPMAENEVRALQQASRTALDRNPARFTPAMPTDRIAGNAYVDSAEVARTAYRAATVAPTPRATADALAHAARAWPTQPAYWVAAGRMSARVSDTALLNEALIALSRLGSGASLLSDTAVQRMARHASIASQANTLKGATASIANGTPMITMRDSNVFAEGVDVDARTGRFYVASIRQRTIFEVTASGLVRDLQVARRSRSADTNVNARDVDAVGANVGAILGVRVARDGQSLYATTAGLPSMRDYEPRDSTLAAIIQVRIADGAVIARWDLPHDGARHLLGDLAIANDGTVYATDSNAPIIWVLAPHGSALTTIRHPLFRSLQGVVPIPSTNALIVADYSHGLLRVDLASREVMRVADANNSSSLGIDGIVWHDGAIIGVQNGVDPAQVVRYSLDPTLSRIEKAVVIDRQPDVADEPTIGTIWRDNFVYVANSQWEKYDDTGHRRPGTITRPTQLVCVSLARYAAVAAAPGTTSSTSATKARNGTRSTASAPPSSRSCSSKDAASP